MPVRRASAWTEPKKKTKQKRKDEHQIEGLPIDTKRGRKNYWGDGGREYHRLALACCSHVVPDFGSPNNSTIPALGHLTLSLQQLKMLR